MPLTFFFLFSPCPVFGSVEVLSCACLHLFNELLFVSLSVSCLSSSLSVFHTLSSGFLLPLLKILRGLPVPLGAERSFK